jgi:hypothetical protein
MKKYFVVNLDRDGKLVLSEQDKLDLDVHVSRYMTDQYKSFNVDRGDQRVKEMELVVIADKDTDSKKVCRVILAAKQAGFSNVNLRESGLPQIKSVEGRRTQLRTLIAVSSAFTIGTIAILGVLLFLARFLVKKTAVRPMANG